MIGHAPSHTILNAYCRVAMTHTARVRRTALSYPYDERKQNDMRRSPQESGTMTLMLALVLVLCLVLFATLAPIAAAQGADEWQDDLLPVSVMMDGESGRVTDDDGVIGNGRTGADHAAESAPHARDMAPRHTPEAKAGMERGAAMDEAGTAVGGSMGALPWIIASLVILAVVLVGLALLPRRGRSR